MSIYQWIVCICLLLLGVLLIHAVAAGTPPPIEWQKVLGGSETDYGNSIQQANDGGFIMAGNTLTNNAEDLPSNHDLQDVCFLKLSMPANIYYISNILPIIVTTPRQTVPDNGKIAFESNHSDSYDTYLLKTEGTSQTWLTNNQIDDFSPAWSPDRSMIAFASDRDGNSEIYLMKADGTGQTRLTDNPAFDGSPAWSPPDGSMIAFASDRDGNSEIYLMKREGTGQTRLSITPSVEPSPALWRPTSPTPTMTTSTPTETTPIPTTLPPTTTTIPPTTVLPTTTVPGFDAALALVAGLAVLIILKGRYP